MKEELLMPEWCEELAKEICENFQKFDTKPSTYLAEYIWNRYNQLTEKEHFPDVEFWTTRLKLSTGK